MTAFHQLAALAPREHFPHLSQVTYLNAASIGLVPLPVFEAAHAFDRDVALRGTTGFDEAAETRVLEGARRSAAKLLHADPDDVAIVKSATEAFAQAAWWVRPPAGTNVVTLDIEHPSTAYPWMRVARDTGAEVRLVQVWDDPASLSLERVAELIDERTSVVVLSLVQYSTGFRFELGELSSLAHAHGALLAVDATQAAGMVPIDVVAGDVDILVAGGYKWLCGPFGAAVCYLRTEVRERFDPPFVGWRSTIDPYTFDVRSMPLPDAARKMEYSTMTYGAAVGLAAAIDYLLGIGIERTLEHDRALGALLVDGLEELGATLLSSREDARRSGIVTARYPERDGEEVAARLNDAGVVVSPRFGATRFSLHLFNDDADIARALDVLEDILG